MKIDPGSVVPIFVQIVNEMQSAIVAGAFREGERIPSAHDLAKQLKVNPNTVQKAYADLAELGVIESKRGIGRFVCKRGSNSALKQSEASIVGLLQNAVELGRSARLSEKRLRELFNGVLVATVKKETA